MQTLLNILLGGGLVAYVVRHVLERRTRRAATDLSDAQTAVQRALKEKTEAEAWNVRLERAQRHIGSLEGSLERLETKVEHFRGEKERAHERASFLEDRIRMHSAEVKLVRISKHNLLDYIQEMEARVRRLEAGGKDLPPFPFKTYADLCGEEDRALAQLADIHASSPPEDIHGSVSPDKK